MYARQSPYDGGPGQLYLANADGTGQVALTDHARVRRQQLAARLVSERQPHRLRVEPPRRHRHLHGRARRVGLKELTFSVGFDGDPTWDPTGTKIAFETNRNGNFDIYVINADGTGQKRLTTDAANDTDPAWSPDGTTIAFTSDRSGSKQIWTMRTDGSNPQQLTSAPNIGGENPAWSPRGGQIAFDSDRGDAGNLDIWTMNSDGSNEQQVTDTPGARRAAGVLTERRARSSSRATAAPRTTATST